MSKIIAIDYGSKRVGVAITDSLRMIAFGLSTILTEEVFVFLDKLIKKESISEIVVGLPKNLDNSQNEITDAVSAFINKLNQKYPDIVINSIDERFTSKMAKKTILDSGVNKKRRRNKSLVDKVSATIILQSYLQKLDR
ncbi:MAG: Holliday junction resolvase RuvX [Flavobacteriales bacterium]|nr:Holliday junction resolvase RuvX [Flavobacteriales bacterium]